MANRFGSLADVGPVINMTGTDLKREHLLVNCFFSAHGPAEQEKEGEIKGTFKLGGGRS